MGRLQRFSRSDRAGAAGWRETARPGPAAALGTIVVVATVALVGAAACTQPPPETLPTLDTTAVELPRADGSLRFAVIGDSGTGGLGQYEVAGAMTSYHEDFPFEHVLMLGDNLYGDEDPADYEAKFETPYAELLGRGVTFHAAIGNHDELAQRHYEHFNMGGEAYYSFRPAGHDVEFFAINTDYLDPEQLTWIERALATSDARWKICFFHHPIYSSGGRHGSDVALREELEPLFIAHGVDVVFAGHDHFYERLEPQNGIVYFVSGAAGKLRRGDIQPSSMTASGFDQDLHFILVEIAGDRMYFQTIARAGTTVDTGAISDRVLRGDETGRDGDAQARGGVRRNGATPGNGDGRRRGAALDDRVSLPRPGVAGTIADPASPSIREDGAPPAASAVPVSPGPPGPAVPTPRSWRSRPPARRGAQSIDSSGTTASTTTAPRTRRERWDALREARRQELESQEAGLEEKSGGILGLLSWPLQRLVAGGAPPGEGLAFVTGGHGSGTGLEGRVRWRDEILGEHDLEGAHGNRGTLTLEASGAISGVTGVSGELAVEKVAGGPFGATLHGDWQRHPRRPYYGIGADSAQSDRVVYLLASLGGGVDAWWEPTGGLETGGGIDLVRYRQGPADAGDGTSVEARFTPATAPGLGTTPTFRRLGARIEYDGRDLPAYPTAGGYYSLRVEDWDDGGNDVFGFRRYRLEVQQMVPFVHGHRVLALRALGELTDLEPGRRVPFYLYTTLGGNDDMRGLRRYRFHGLHRMLMQVEYRWQAWIGLDVALFADAGRVFDEIDDLRLDDLEAGYGVGFRFTTQEFLVLRLDLATGTRGPETHLSFNHVF